MIKNLCDAFMTKIQGSVARTRHATVEGVQTDAEGRFELTDVPRNLVYLRGAIPGHRSAYGMLRKSVKV